MNTINSSIGMTGFQLHSGFSPKLIHPLIPQLPSTSILHEFDTHDFLKNIQMDVLEAQDCLLSSKIDQVHSHNQHRCADPAFQLNDCVLLRTKHRKNECTNVKVKSMPLNFFLVTMVHT
ncbi:hypothetical protein F5877DRAFT_54539 [Lentinula edodes]|nr:hypothetical protein F5877DRAFT_54539 [Lentinula edodes]